MRISVGAGGVSDSYEGEASMLMFELPVEGSATRVCVEISLLTRQGHFPSLPFKNRAENPALKPRT